MDGTSVVDSPIAAVDHTFNVPMAVGKLVIDEITTGADVTRDVGMVVESTIADGVTTGLDVTVEAVVRTALLKHICGVVESPPVGNTEVATVYWLRVVVIGGAGADGMVVGKEVTDVGKVLCADVFTDASVMPPYKISPAKQLPN